MLAWQSCHILPDLVKITHCHLNLFTMLTQLLGPKQKSLHFEEDFVRWFARQSSLRFMLPLIQWTTWYHRHLVHWGQKSHLLFPKMCIHDGAINPSLAKFAFDTTWKCLMEGLDFGPGGQIFKVTWEVYMVTKVGHFWPSSANIVFRHYWPCSEPGMASQYWAISSCTLG